jgi:hypothetical protein
VKIMQSLHYLKLHPLKWKWFMLFPMFHFIFYFKYVLMHGKIWLWVMLLFARIYHLTCNWLQSSNYTSKSIPKRHLNSLYCLTPWPGPSSYSPEPHHRY